MNRQLAPEVRLEPQPPVETRFARLAPLVEGGVLALLVLVLVTLGGETVRTGLDGYRQVALGEAVLRDGLLPENPWHAGARTEAATLHPLLAVLLGATGMGPLWGIALLAVLGAALFPPALDSLGKALGLSAGVRRFVFLGALLGFNGLGWLGALPAEGGGLAAAMAVDGGYLPPSPLIALLPMTFPDTAFAWDGRLTAFLPALLATDGFALALPFALLALAWSLRARADAAWRAALCAGIALALRPEVGVWASLLVLSRWGTLLRANRLPPARAARALALGCAVALPFLLPTLLPGSGDRDWTAPFAYPGHGGWADFSGPLCLLLPFGLAGLVWSSGNRRAVLLAALLPLSLAVVVGWGSAATVYLTGVAWAIPAGLAAAKLARRPLGAAVVAVLLVAFMPTTVRAFQAYRYWDASASLPLVTRDGRLTVTSERQAAWPPSVAAAEAEVAGESVLVFHPRHPATRVGGAFAALGNGLVPVLGHSLYVDLPHAGNRGAPDLEARLDRAHALWEGRGWPLSPEDSAPLLTPDAALEAMRASLPRRGFAIASVTSDVASAQLFRQSGGSLLAEEQGTSLWWFPPLQTADAD